MVAVLADELAGRDELRQHLEAAHAGGGRFDHRGDARPRPHAIEPRGEPRAVRRRVAVERRSLHVRYDREVAPTERVDVEERARPQLLLEPGVDAGRLLGGAAEKPLGETTLRALEDVDLEAGPVDRLVVGVADVLEHAHPRALRGRLRQQRRRRPAVLDVLEDHRRVEDCCVAVDQGRHLEARVEGAELSEVAAGERWDLGLERHALLGERDLHLLRVRGEWMLVELHHARD